MIKVLVLVALFLVLLVPSVIAQQKVFEISLVVFGTDEVNQTIDDVVIPTYQRFIVNLTDLKLAEITFITNNTKQLFRDDLKADLISDSQVVYSTFIPISFLLPESATFVPFAQAVVFLPYSEKAETVKIYKDDKELMSVDLKQICNSNKQCDQYENYLSCSQDCQSGSKDNFCDKVEDDICDKDCLIGDPDCYSYPKYDKFTPSLTTDFKKINKTFLGYLRNVKLGIEGKGQIDFGESRIDVSGADLDSYVNIEKDRISIDYNKLPGLNKSASITFFGSSGKIHKNGVGCTDCNITQNNGNIVVEIENLDGVYTVSPYLQKITVDKKEDNVLQIAAVILVVIIIIILCLILIRRVIVS